MRLLVNIDVDDLEKAIAFYSTALDLRLSRKLFNDSVAEMIGASSTIYLLARPQGSSAAASGKAQRDYRRHWTPVHLDFAVEDVAAASQRAIVAGATLERGIESFAWGSLAMLSDPFGHGFCLLQFEADGYGKEAAR